MRERTAFWRMRLRSDLVLRPHSGECGYEATRSLSLDATLVVADVFGPSSTLLSFIESTRLLQASRKFATLRP
jgi:hypothetical protein